MTSYRKPPDAKWNNCLFWFTQMIIINTERHTMYAIRRINNNMWKAAEIDEGRIIGNFHVIDNSIPVEKMYQEYMLNKSIEETICQSSTQET